MTVRLRGIAGDGNSPDFGERRLQARRILFTPVEVARKAKIVGQELGAPPCLEDLGQGPGLHGLAWRSVSASSAGDLSEAFDGLLIARTRPGKSRG